MSDAPSPGGFSASDPRGKTVLIVDDDEGILDLVSLLVKTAGFNILTASNGEKGIELLAKNPDGVVLDLIMPGCGGLGVLNYLKLAGGPTPPVLVITAYERRHPRSRRPSWNPSWSNAWPSPSSMKFCWRPCIIPEDGTLPV